MEHIQERHSTIREIAEELHLSDKTTRRLFINEPGVITITTYRPHKRVYRSLRVPDYVKRRVIERLTRRVA